MKINKNIVNTFLAITIISVLSACQKDFLDQVPDDRLTIDDVFKRRSDAERYLANVYSHIKSDNDWNTSNSPWEGLSDEIDVTYNDYPTYFMNTGNWDKNNDNYPYWRDYYRGIRSASYFLQHIDECVELKELAPELLPRYKAEARALRAWFYFFIMRQYGPFVIMPETPMAPDATLAEMSIPRSSLDECVSYIESELDKAIVDLPEKPVNTSNWGRFNQAMAKAIKSRMLLYAASPLFNGNTDYVDFVNNDGKQLINQTYDVNKWKKAADAAKEVIDLPGYKLYKEFDGSSNIKAYESCKNVFLKDWNEEIIMARVNGMYSVDKNGSPYHVGGWSSWGPTQQVVDAFFMANGRSISDPSSGYSETGFTASGTSYYDVGTSNMYINREPRFYVAITFNGSKWINPSAVRGTETIQLYNGGNSGKYTGRNWSRTGYCVRKKVNPSSTVNPEVIAERTEVLIRLGEIYLNYAEALNEYDPGNPDILIYLNMIRERAGIPQYGVGTTPLPVPANQEEMREAIRKERRVELAFEIHRYFDTRRWKIAQQTDGGPFYGMNTEATNTAGFTVRTVFETRQFLPKHYLWNITQDELNRNPNLVGNPGW
jgi:hypothetical protein